MRNNMLWKKGLVIGIIALFIGISVIPSTGKIDVTTSGTTIYDGSLSGYVNDTSMNPIEGARVRVYFHETYEEDYSDEDGYYHVTNIPICYCLKNATCYKEGYETEWVLLSIVEDTTHDFILTSNNQPPTVPIIDGPTYGKAGVAYYYTFVSTDPNGYDVFYWIVWGDDAPGEFYLGPYPSGLEVTIRHIFYKQGIYNISAQALSGGGRSGWATLTVTMPRNRAINGFFLRLLEQFPMLRHLLRL